MCCSWFLRTFRSLHGRSQASAAEVGNQKMAKFPRLRGIFSQLPGWVGPGCTDPCSLPAPGTRQGGSLSAILAFVVGSGGSQGHRRQVHISGRNRPLVFSSLLTSVGRLCPTGAEVGTVFGLAALSQWTKYGPESPPCLQSASSSHLLSPLVRRRRSGDGEVCRMDGAPDVE